MDERYLDRHDGRCEQPAWLDALLDETTFIAFNNSHAKRLRLHRLKRASQRHRRLLSGGIYVNDPGAKASESARSLRAP